MHIQEVDCGTPYRQVEVLQFLETSVPAPEAEELSRELRDAAAARLKEPLPLPDSTPPSLLADLLMQTLQASRSLIERAFIEPDVSARAQLALREAERCEAAEEEELEASLESHLKELALQQEADAVHVDEIDIEVDQPDDSGK